MELFTCLLCMVTYRNGYFTGPMYIHVVKCLPIIKLQALPGAKEGDG